MGRQHNIGTPGRRRCQDCGEERVRILHSIALQQLNEISVPLLASNDIRLLTQPGYHKDAKRTGRSNTPWVVKGPSAISTALIAWWPIFTSEGSYLHT